MTEAITWPRKTRELHTRIFDSTVLNEFAYRDDDIVIATYPKAGTTWLQQIVGQLLFARDPALDVNALSLRLDGTLPPKDELLAIADAQTHRRFFKTHLPVEALVFSPWARWVYVARDGRDVIWSVYSHMANYSQEYRDLLNSLPGDLGPPVVPPPADIRQVWQGWLKSGTAGGLNFWEHVRGWWAIRALPNVLLVHYASLKRDLPEEMRRIAAFLEIPIDESRWDAIVEYSTFDWMKANASKIAPRGDASWEGGATVFFHRGVNGRWSDTLTPEEIAEYEARAIQELGPECAHWLATGEGP